MGKVCILEKVAAGARTRHWLRSRARLLSAILSGEGGDPVWGPGEFPPLNPDKPSSAPSATSDWGPRAKRKEAPHPDKPPSPRGAWKKGGRRPPEALPPAPRGEEESRARKPDPPAWHPPRRRHRGTRHGGGTGRLPLEQYKPRSVPDGSVLTGAFLHARRSRGMRALLRWNRAENSIPMLQKAHAAAAGLFSLLGRGEREARVIRELSVITSEAEGRLGGWDKWAPAEVKLLYLHGVLFACNRIAASATWLAEREREMLSEYLKTCLLVDRYFLLPGNDLVDQTLRRRLHDYLHDKKVLWNIVRHLHEKTVLAPLPEDRLFKFIASFDKVFDSPEKKSMNHAFLGTHSVEALEKTEQESALLREVCQSFGSRALALKGQVDGLDQWKGAEHMRRACEIAIEGRRPTETEVGLICDFTENKTLSSAELLSDQDTWAFVAMKSVIWRSIFIFELTAIGSGCTTDSEAVYAANFSRYVLGLPHGSNVFHWGKKSALEHFASFALQAAEEGRKHRGRKRVFFFKHLDTLEWMFRVSQMEHFGLAAAEGELHQQYPPELVAAVDELYALRTAVSHGLEGPPK